MNQEVTVACAGLGGERCYLCGVFAAQFNKLDRMNDSWRDTLRSLKFRDHGELGSMRAVMEHVEFIATPHPINGLCLTATYINERDAGQTDTFVPFEASPELVSYTMLELLKALRPEFRTTLPILKRHSR